MATVHTQSYCFKGFHCYTANIRKRNSVPKKGNRTQSGSTHSYDHSNLLFLPHLQYYNYHVQNYHKIITKFNILNTSHIKFINIKYYRLPMVKDSFNLKAFCIEFQAFPRTNFIVEHALGFL